MIELSSRLTKPMSGIAVGFSVQLVEKRNEQRERKRVERRGDDVAHDVSRQSPPMRAEELSSAVARR